MVQWCCRCLNVIINTTNSANGLKKLPVSEIGYINENPFENEFVYESRITLEGPQLAMDSLINYKNEKTTAGEVWSVLRCCNCDLVCLATSLDSDRIIINSLMLSDPKDIAALQSDYNYSSFYKLILREHDAQVDLSTVYIETRSFKKFEEKIEHLKKLKEDHVRKEKYNCEECIRIFAANQRLKTKELEETLNNEFDKLMTAHFKTRKLTTAIEQKTEEEEEEDAVVARCWGDVGNSKHDKLEKDNGANTFEDFDGVMFPEDKGLGKYSCSSNSSLDETFSDDDSENETIPGPIIGTAPISMNNNWGGRQSKDDQDDDEEINIAKSMKELAKSICSGNSTDVFGGLPRTRLASRNIDAQ